jgi:hypothetical protein
MNPQAILELVQLLVTYGPPLVRFLETEGPTLATLARHVGPELATLVTHLRAVPPEALHALGRLLTALAPPPAAEASHPST